MHLSEVDCDSSNSVELESLTVRNYRGPQRTESRNLKGAPKAYTVWTVKGVPSTRVRVRELVGIIL